MTATLLILGGAFVGLSIVFLRALRPPKQCPHNYRAVGPNLWKCRTCGASFKW